MNCKRAHRRGLHGLDSPRFGYWLQLPARGVIEGVVKQKDLLCGQAKALEAFDKVLESGAVQSTVEKRLEVLATKMDFQRLLEVKRIRQVSHRAHVLAYGAAVRKIDLFDQGWLFALGDLLLAIRADWLVSNSVPWAAIGLTPIARRRWHHLHTRDDA
jgi:hypothetical protein